MPFGPTDELDHPGAAVEEWMFVAWTAIGDIGLVSGHRLVGRRAWYWSAFAREGRPLLHLAEWSVIVRADPFVVKAPEMWAEHHCDDPMRQWSIGNEAYFAELADPDEALGRGYGVPRPTAFDVEWYATGDPTEIPGGYEQPGVVHGAIEVQGRPKLEVMEIPAHRWHRWSRSDDLPPIELAPAGPEETGPRAPFAFPGGVVADWVVTPRGWRSRAPRTTG